MSDLQSLIFAFGNELVHSLYHYKHSVEWFNTFYGAISAMYGTDTHLPYKTLEPLYIYLDKIVQSDIRISQLDPQGSSIWVLDQFDTKRAFEQIEQWRDK
uniref:hypothetical protein n=1 Tax=Aspergillus sclerotioniger TaxID=319627 RepID=UPI002114C217|nr:hypothetical protein NQV51_mgp01 [Aspergillus sclerotioniger]USH57593.1 hypothetical protein [Aspergillus sclerotioniger]